MNNTRIGKYFQQRTDKKKVVLVRPGSHEGQICGMSSTVESVFFGKKYKSVVKI